MSAVANGEQATDDVVRVEVVRAEPGEVPGPDGPRTSVYEVPADDRMSVLDALQWIKDHRDPTLTFRWSCKMAVCGSCGVMVNGRAVLGCETFVRGYRTSGITVGPLEHFEVQRDLAVETDGFLGKLRSVAPWLVGRSAGGAPAESFPIYHPTAPSSPSPARPATIGNDSASAPPASSSGDAVVDALRSAPSAPGPSGVAAIGNASASAPPASGGELSVNLQTPAQMGAFGDFAQCIDCMLCYAACPQLDVVPSFVGPAAVATARRWDADSRDGGELERANLLDVEEGVWPCIQNGACTQACPKGVDPARALRDAQRVAEETWEARQG